MSSYFGIADRNRQWWWRRRYTCLYNLKSYVSYI